MGERHRVGRPKLDPNDPSPSVGVSIRLSARQYDALYERARLERRSVPEVIRAALDRPRRTRTGEEDESE
jgi:hypothetical protein